MEEHGDVAPLLRTWRGAGLAAHPNNAALAPCPPLQHRRGDVRCYSLAACLPACLLIYSAHPPKPSEDAPPPVALCRIDICVAGPDGEQNLTVELGKTLMVRRPSASASAACNASGDGL